MKGAIIVIISLVIIGLGVRWWFNRDEANLPGLINTEVPRSLSINLNSERDSGVTGRVVLNELGGELSLELNLNAPVTASSTPAHSSYEATIYQGSCAFIGKVAYPLAKVQNNTSLTSLPLTFATLEDRLPLAIKLEVLDEAEKKVPIACGEIEF